MTGTTIALARILPGTLEAPLHISIEEVSTDASPEYKAISYVPSSETTEVSLNEQSHPLDSSLENALRALRTTEPETLIWAEGLTNSLERTATSKDAYSNAKEVRIWVGEGDSSTSAAIEILQKLAEQWRVLTTALQLPENFAAATPQDLVDIQTMATQILSEKMESITGLQDPAVVASADKLTDASYFRHVRAITAIVLAKSVVIMMGTSTISWMDYVDSMSLIVCSKDMPLKCSLEHVQLTSGIKIAVRRWGEDPKSLELLPMLQQSRQADCSDPREKIFDLLPIISPSKRVALGAAEEQPPLRVDWSASQQQVFIDAAKYMIGERQDLLLWNNVPASSKPNRLPGLPSWAPDWSDSSEANALKLRASMGLRSWENAPCVQLTQKPLSITPSGNLKAQVHLFSKVKTIASRPFTEHNFHTLVLGNLSLLPPTEKLKRKDEYPRALILDQGPAASYTVSALSKTWTSLAARFQMLKMLGISPAQVIADPDMVRRSITSPPEPGLMHLAEVARRVNTDALGMSLAQAYGRRFLVLENGMLGLGFDEKEGWGEENRVREGDVIAVFVGGYFPYLLREVEGESGKYRLLGEVHVQGLMDGEALKDMGWLVSAWKDVEVKDVEIV